MSVQSDAHAAVARGGVESDGDVVESDPLEHTVEEVEVHSAQELALFHPRRRNASWLGDNSFRRQQNTAPSCVATARTSPGQDARGTRQTPAG